MKVKLLLVMTIVAVGSLAGCTGANNTPNADSGRPSGSSPAASENQVLPPFPSSVSGSILLKRSGGPGDVTLNTLSARKGKLTVEATCVGSATEKMTVDVLSSVGASLFRTNGAPCLGEIRNIGLAVPASPKGYTIRLSVPVGGKYAILVTQ
jgi:hypothetical protein